jgi:hypothetical protein
MRKLGNKTPCVQAWIGEPDYHLWRSPISVASGLWRDAVLCRKIVDPSEGAKYASQKTRAVYFPPSASRCSESRIPEIGKP